MRRWICLLLTLAICGASGWYCRGVRLEGETVSGARGQAGMQGLAAKVPVSKVSAMDAAAVKVRFEAALKSTARNTLELELLMARWVAVDLEGAKAWMRAFAGDIKDSSGDRRPLVLCFKAWAALDPEAAMEEGLTLKGDNAEAALRGVLAGMGRADAATIQSVLQKAPSDNYFYEEMVSLVRQLAGRDPAGARTMALSLKGLMGENAVQATASVWARTDPQAALAWAQQQEKASARERASIAVLTEWARRDPAAVGPLLLQKTPGSPDRFYGGAAAEALARLSASSPQEAVDFAAKYIPPERLKESLGNLYWRLLINDGASQQSTAALCQVVALLPPDALKDAKLFTRGWSRYETMKPVWDRVMTEPDSPARSFLLGQMGQKLFGDRPAEFINELMQLPDNAVRQNLLESSFQGWMGYTSTVNDDWRAGIASLRSAVDSLPESVRPLGVRKLAWTALTNDIQEAAALVPHYPSLAADADFMRNLAIQYNGASGIGGTQAWIDSLPDESARAIACEGVVLDWYDKDGGAASQWVDSLPPGARRDAAASALAMELQKDDPATAFTWAASILDPSKQADAVKSAVAVWGRDDWGAASEAIERAAFSAEQKASLQQSISRFR